jgi:Cu(I)/Ag(I) efflux system membrane protein CusA/SilA
MLRDDLSAIRQVRIPTPTGARVPLGDVATLRLEGGPSMIKSENARLNAWVFVDLRDGVDAGTAVARAQARVAERVSIPAGVSIRWSGQHEYMQRAADRLRLLVPLTVAIVFLLLLLHLGSPRDALVLMLPLPFALVGAVWLLAALGYNMSVAVAVGMIAVVGLAVETGIVMYVFLDESVDRFRREGRLNTAADLLDAIEQAATDRLRPVLMTVLTSAIGLLPIMFGTSIGSEVMRRIAAPMVGGLATAAILTLVVIPAIYSIVHGRELPPPRRV